MTAHELAKRLLEGPDLTVTVNGGKGELANGKECSGVHMHHQISDDYYGPSKMDWVYGWLDKEEDYSDTNLGTYKIRPVVNIIS